MKELPKKREVEPNSNQVELEQALCNSFNDCHDQFTEAIVERLEKLKIIERRNVKDRLYFFHKEELDELIKELK